MAGWNDPRVNPVPPCTRPPRALAKDEPELTPLLAACKRGRFYEVEAWVASGRPLQLDPGASRSRKAETLLGIAIETGAYDLARLALCNGYRVDLEPTSALDSVLLRRDWDMLELLLQWGAAPASADLSLILGSFDRGVFERFWMAGVDLTAGDAMAHELSHSGRNRPLFGFARAHREEDARIP